MIRVLVATVVGVLPVFLVGGLSVLIARDIPLDEQRLGLVAAVFWAASALCSWPAGRLADRIGAPVALGVGAGLSAIAAGIVALSGSLGSLVAAMLVGGAGNALTVPGCNLAVARSLDPRRQGRAFGFKQAALSTGVFLAGLALPVAVAVGGWRTAFVGASALALVCVAAVTWWESTPAPGCGAFWPGPAPR